MILWLNFIESFLLLFWQDLLMNNLSIVIAYFTNLCIQHEFYVNIPFIFWYKNDKSLK